MKKVLIFLLVLSTLSFVSCKKKENGKDVDDNPTTFEVKTITENDSVYIWGAPSEVAIVRDISIINQCEFWGEEWLDNTDKLNIEAIKGEREYFQIMLTAKQDVNSFTATVKSDLSDGTHTIEKSNIEILAERYIQVKSPSSKSRKASMYAGWYPDALVPMASYKARKENKIAKDEHQGLVVMVNIPSSTVAGVYTGSIDITVDGKTSTLTYSLKVYDVSMPEVNHCNTAIDIWENEITKGEFADDEDGNIIDWAQIYYDFLLDRKITPQQLPNTLYINTYVDRLVEYANNPKVTLYRLPYKAESHTFESSGQQSVVSYSNLVELLTWMAEKNIALRETGDLTTDLFKKAYFYFGSIIDEPSATKYDAVRYCDLAVTRAKKEVSILLNDYPDLKNSLLSIPHVVTTSYNTSLIGSDEEGGVQTWCCEVQNATSELLIDAINRKNSNLRYYQGEGTWIYMTCNSNNPNPSMQLDDNLMGPRVLQWINMDYGIQSTLFWNSCYYSKYTTTTTTRDIWNDPLSWVFANGDGYLLYPGSRYGLTEPLATLRLESFSQGSEEYEYLYMIKELIKQLNEKNHTTFEANEVIKVLCENVYSSGTIMPKTNIQNFINNRTITLELLDALTNNQDKATELINNLLKK